MNLAATPTPPDAQALETPFLNTLVRLVRAQDAYGVWETIGDAKLLDAYVMSKEKRRSIPILGDPDPEVVGRVERFYAAIGLTIEQEVGHVASPLIKLSHEGFGRVILTVGKLVVLSRHLRDVHRFGFDSLAALAEDGAKHVAAAVATIRRFPEVADD